MLQQQPLNRSTAQPLQRTLDASCNSTDAGLSRRSELSGGPGIHLRRIPFPRLPSRNPAEKEKATTCKKGRPLRRSFAAGNEDGLHVTQYTCGWRRYSTATIGGKRRDAPWWTVGLRDLRTEVKARKEKRSDRSSSAMRWRRPQQRLGGSCAVMSRKPAKSLL